MKTIITEVREPIPAYGNKKWTAEEYLEMERNSPEKHEYYNGQVFAMSGAGTRHEIIISNLIISLGNKLKGKPCQPFGSNLRVHIPENTLYTYPDVSVVCKEDLVDDDEDNITKPILLIEVLSKSTRRYDRGQKFELYKDIPTLKEYILVDTEGVSVENFHRASNARWARKEYKQLTTYMPLHSLDISLPLTEIYAGTRFSKNNLFDFAD